MQVVCIVLHILPMCAYVRVCVCMISCVFVCVCTYVCVCFAMCTIDIHICVCVCTYVCVCVCVFCAVCTFDIHLCVCVRVCMCVCVCCGGSTLTAPRCSSLAESHLERKLLFRAHCPPLLHCASHQQNISNIECGAKWIQHIWV